MPDFPSATFTEQICIFGSAISRAESICVLRNKKETTTQLRTCILNQKTLKKWGKDHCTACLQFNKTGFDQNEKMLLFVSGEAVESKPVKLETIRT